MNRYTLPDLSYAYDALEPLYSSEMLELHHAKHHNAYVESANKTLDAFDAMRKDGDYAHLNELQKTLAFSVSGHVMHSIFWKNMSPDGGSEPTPELAGILSEEFGSVDALREQMSRAAASLQGSGWVSLSWEAMGRGLIVEQVYDHQGNTGSATLPILTIDCWEHAFYLQYRNQKSQWIDAFWDLVNWKDVESRLQASRKVGVAAL